MTGGGSVVVRRQLGVRLRKLREIAGKDLNDVVESGIGSKAKISRIENGRLPVKMADIRALCWLYGADQGTADALAAMAPGTQQDDWWEVYGEAVVPDWFGLYAGLEVTASRMRDVSLERVHGLLQTRDYAVAVTSADPRLSPDVVEKRVGFRVGRQQTVLETDPVPSMTLILGEAALSLVVGSREVMDAQIAHLRSLPDTHPDVDVRVLPFAKGAYPGRGSFTILDFDDEEDPSVVYVEIPKGARYFDRPDDRADYEYVFDLIAGRSVPIGEWSP